jgi:putative oxidoreductase
MAVLSKLGRYRNHGLLIIRVGLGIMFIYHGLPKLLEGPERWERIGKAMGSLGIHFFPGLWGFLSAVTETIGGVLLMTGLFFRPVCILLLINMIVAVLSLFSRGESFFDASQAIEDAIIFAGLIFVGPGLYSVDKNDSRGMRLDA